MNTTRYALKVFLAAAASLGLLCITAGAVFAAPARPMHAKVWKADPGIGATIAQAPTRVTVFALEEVNPDPAKSNLQVYGPSADATDTQISQGNAQVSLSDPRQMSISITPNSGHTNGVYIVYWKTTSAADGDVANGTFAFTVNSTGASASASASTPAPATTSGTSAPGLSVWVPIVAALAALIVGLGAGLGLGRRKTAPSSLATMRASLSRDRSAEEETSKH